MKLREGRKREGSHRFIPRTERGDVDYYSMGMGICQ